ncbi:MAG: mechanosensitive ion channel [Candidatus Omnitrophica bacterium]|nr:mechanosensitive ion channel [Candidatus Omnitrophota bacterium]
MDEKMIEKIYGYVIQYGLSFLYAVLIFIIGRAVAQFISQLIEKALNKVTVNLTLVSFGKHLAYYLLMTFVVIAALNKLGVETSSFIAVVGAASLAVGLALQGSLSNFASGVMLILFQPFKVGDAVEVGGAQGKVKEIHIFNTIIINTDKTKKIIIPNSKITSDKIVVELDSPSE